MCEIIRIADVLRKVGVLHRDVKPDNICMREADGGESQELVLIDFGTGLFENDMDGVDVKIAGVGAPSFRAPEL